MVGSINNGYPQQAAIIKSLTPGISSDKTTQNTVQENSKNETRGPVFETQNRDSVGAQKEARPVLQVNQNTEIPSRSADRGQNLDISV